ncbi:sulfatase [bacterium]|nr:sulfatase [bacterium]
MNTPNILYFIAHDVGRHLGCYGARVASPHLDAFADSAVRFDNAFCNSPACTPSRICAMTGMYAHTTGGVGLAHIGWPLAQDVPTIVDCFNDAGYETIHSGMEHERHPRENHYAVDLEVHWNSYNTQRGVDDALAYLGTRDRSKPFYLNIGSQQPHASTWRRTDDLYGGPVPPEDVYIPPYLPDLPSIRRDLGRFQAAIRYMDAHFGRLIEGLGTLGHDRDTIVIFTTDHGISAPRAKGTLYDRGVETALLVRLPGGRLAGTRADHLVQNIDLAPTLLDAAGVPVPGRMQGRSFWPLLNEAAYTPHDAIFIERNFHGESRVFGRQGEFIDRYDPVRAIRTRDFHLIRHFDPQVKCRPWLPFEVDARCVPEADSIEFALPRPREPRQEIELYHTRHDPQEFVNIAGRPEFRAIQHDLDERLSQWMRDTDDFVLRDDVPRRRERPSFGCFDGMPGDEAEARAKGFIKDAGH